MIHCACCCEPFHYYCVEGVSPDTGDDWWLVDWVCPQCTLCNTCGKGGGAQVACQRCHKSHHSECLAADRVASRLHSADRPWVCIYFKLTVNSWFLLSPIHIELSIVKVKKQNVYVFRWHYLLAPLDKQKLVFTEKMSVGPYVSVSVVSSGDQKIWDFPKS